ncbi:MAG: AAA family ATPase, partial [Bacteroidales bacterium]|nr:AAA family ATPase [Bacteroidales bacterium]
GEFRKALEEEIKSAKTDAYGQAISLISGRKISQMGKSFQYSFHLENALNLPIDAPGELHIPNRKPVEITIVSVEGLTILLGSREDLGDYVPQARLVSDLTFLLKKLVERIEELADTENNVGDRILKNNYVLGEFKSKIYPTDEKSKKLNKKQQEALQSSLVNNLTYIWGPPGTGKTQTIGSIGHQLQNNGRSLLIVSHTNTAVDHALINIAGQVSEQIIEQGKILRVGDPKDQRLRVKFRNTLLEAQVEKRSTELTNKLSSFKEELTTYKAELHKITKEIELYDWFSEAKNDLRQMRSDTDNLLRLELELTEQRKRYIELREQSSFWKEAKEKATAINEKIIQLGQIDEKLIETNQKFEESLSTKERISSNLQSAKKVLAETNSVNWIVRNWRRLPSPDQQEKLVDDFERQLKRTETHHDQLVNQLNVHKTSRDRLKIEISGFWEIYSIGPDEILSEEKKYQHEIDKLVETGIKLRNLCTQHRAKISKLFRERLLILQQLGYSETGYGTAEEMFIQIEKAFVRLEEQVEAIDINQNRLKLKEILNQIEQLEAEILRIEELLSHIEETVIAEADIVATTLTRAYLRDSIRSRKYDTVIVDEASMAPIPAIWVASSIIENNAIIVGDPKQLPPIVTSASEMAEKWLGRDIFLVSEIINKKTENLIQLNEQYRMHPAITAIPNQFFYINDEKLVNPKSEDTIDSIEHWYNVNWGYDSPVILVDTGSIHAWVTSVPRGKSSSRLNFLSAVLCVDLCKVLLKNGRSGLASTEAKRIIIQCPYNPHAKLLDLLLRESKLEDDVEAGTVHTFQGSEADVVILDLVNDEPHWRVGLFMPQNDDNVKRLFNVSVTRAKQRLIVVGDFSYNENQAKKAFLGREFIPFLKENYPMYSATEIVSLDLLNQAVKARNLISPGHLDKNVTHLVVTQDDFYRFLLDDFYSARARIVIYSPFITENRLSELQAALFYAINQGIQIYIVTKPLQERGKREVDQYRYIEKSLQEWGSTIIHKRKMHEKLIIIDDNILWSGSLNPLSFSNTQEIMERRVSEKLV